ncbi:hypothetical protein QJS04_geneDACA003283 [Acorus gramineus]|uniref:Cyclin B1 n=1 Tax=Acorus gramineus TaxID=55184 RepID=A0AAV9BP08_ACOGR|nr:hypothetical protein QJS04_geneDACA003283 [Acorus gramineus]
MATRAAEGVPHQTRGGAAKKGVTTEGNNDRRALGDVSNLVNTRVVGGKPVVVPHRPITRSFGAQLLAKAEAAVAANKKLETHVADGVMVRKAKVVKSKVPAVPKPKPEVIEISPDTEEAIQKLEAMKITMTKETAKEGKKSRKPVQTFTSVLTARSKFACGLNERPEEKIEEIDACDMDDQLAVVEYVEDIYTYYKIAETACRFHQDYLGTQTEINEKMRAILADWLVEVHAKFELMPETLFLTQHIIDKYLSMQMVSRRELQLVGISAMLIACKYEEIWAPEINDFICISAKMYSREQVLAMETTMLNKIDWCLTVPTPYMFLVRFIKAAMADKELEHMAFFYAELALMQYSLTSYCPSMIAASAVYAACCALNKTPCWNATDCAKLLASSHSMVEGSKLKVVYRKYSGSQRLAVALHPPAEKLLHDDDLT